MPCPPILVYPAELPAAALGDHPPAPGWHRSNPEGAHEARRPPLPRPSIWQPHPSAVAPPLAAEGDPAGRATPAMSYDSSSNLNREAAQDRRAPLRRVNVEGASGTPCSRRMSGILECHGPAPPPIGGPPAGPWRTPDTSMRAPPAIGPLRHGKLVSGMLGGALEHGWCRTSSSRSCTPAGSASGATR